MILSEKGKQHLIAAEGLKLDAYKDSRGIPTIGIGYVEVNGKPVQMGDKMSRDQVFEILPKILELYETTVTTTIKVKLYQHQFDALVCFCFNIGRQGFANSEVVKAVNQNKEGLAVLSFFNWRKPPEIVGRRWNDANLFVTGIYLI